VLAGLVCLPVLTLALVGGCARAPAAETSRSSPAPVAQQEERMSVHLRSDGDLSALEVLEKSGIDYAVQGEGANAFVTGVAGYAPADDEFWALYVDGVASTVGAGSVSVEVGATIEWRLEAIE